MEMAVTYFFRKSIVYKIGQLRHGYMGRGSVRDGILVCNTRNLSQGHLFYPTLNNKSDTLESLQKMTVCTY